jgi:hypothetical protein
MTRADSIKARIAQNDGKQGCFKIGAACCSDMMRGIDKASANFDEPFVAGLAVFGVDKSSKVGLNIMGMAFRSARDVGLNGAICPRAQGGCGHLAMKFDQAGDHFGRPMVDAFGRIAVAEEDKRITPSELADLSLCVLPAFPEPSLVMIVAKAKGVAAEDFAIGREKADS